MTGAKSAAQPGVSVPPLTWAEKAVLVSACQCDFIGSEAGTCIMNASLLSSPLSLSSFPPFSTPV